MSHPATFVSAGLLSLSVVIGAAMLSHAGPLDPPAGPVAPSYKTLTDVEPRIAINATNTPGSATAIFVISKPGSYYLTAPVNGVSGKHGIQITTGNVSIDLAGFAVEGVEGSLRGIDGQSAGNIALRNGSINNWGQDGVLIGGLALVENLSLLNWVNDGLNVGSLSSIRNCIGSGLGTRGIVAGTVSTVSNCVIAGTSGNGIQVSQSIVTGCTVNNCGVGLSAGADTTVSGCVLQVNRGDGIQAGIGCLIYDNMVGHNGSGVPDGAGIRLLSSNARVERNNVINNDIGIKVVNAGNIIMGNTCADNSVNNYDIALGNRYGPIVNIIPATAPAATGNSAPGTLTTTDPMSNFAY